MIFTAVGLTLICFMVALAVDASYLYMVKAKLSASCDAAALAAARSLNVGMTMSDQEASARNRAAAFFTANFPAGHLNTHDLTTTIDVRETALRTRTVSVDATVKAPTYFLRMAGYNEITVSAVGKASRRDVNLIMVLDRSGSMQNSGSCTPMKDAAKNFVSKFAEGRDRLGLIVYSSAWFLGFAPAQNFKTASPTLDATINSVSCVGGTNSATALSEAYNQLVAINEPGALNLILFFTDGLPTGLTASFPIKRSTDTRYGDGSSTYDYTNNSYSYPKSTCKDAAGRSNSNAAWDPQNRLGALVSAGQGTESTGYTYGLYANYATAINATEFNSIDGPANSETSRDGCSFGAGTANLNTVRRDIAYIPNADAYGNATNCCYRTVSTFGSGTYSGRIRPDKPSSVGGAATNATDNAATRIRSDATFNPVIYVIGLGDPSGSSPPDQVLLAKVANDPTSASYVDTQPTGLFVFSPNNTQLNLAFARIASEILRLSR